MLVNKGLILRRAVKQDVNPENFLTEKKWLDNSQISTLTSTIYIHYALQITEMKSLKLNRN